MATKLTAEQQKWQAQDDAHILAQAESIKSDPKRITAAKKEAANMVKEQEQRAQAMKKVAGNATKTTVKTSTKTQTKTPTKKK